MKFPLINEFEHRFGASPTFHIRAPGRVNLIGEHTDYNEGYVLPMAIDRAIHIILRPRPDSRVSVHSLDYDETAQFDAAAPQRGGPQWAEYIKGVAWAMQADGLRLRGWEGVLTGDIPRGAGLSSSAALEIAAGLAFAAAADLQPDPVKLAKLGRQAENEWVGVRCGIMDQMACAASKQGHALLLDCRTLAYEHIPLPPDVRIAILDTATRRGLVDSAYNERRAACEQAAQRLGVRALRDLDEAGFRSRAGALDDITQRRARHVVSENGRVLQAVEALRRGDAAALGRLLDVSHTSLRDDFEVSSEALNSIVAIARRQPGCYGARMTGAGFGGCAVALVQQESAEAFAQAAARRYRQESGLDASIYITRACAGADFARLTI
jgi:galactokinase